MPPLARAAMYILVGSNCTTRYTRSRRPHGDRQPTLPTLRALLGRRDLHLRLEGEAADLERGALDRPVRWVHSSDLADPTPFLSEGLALLTTGTQFQDAERRPRRVPRVRAAARGARGGRTRLRHRGRARRHPAGPGGGVPRRADAAVRGAVPHAVHRRRPRERRGDRRPGLRAAQLGARRAARDRARGAPARRPGRHPRRARPPARHVGGHVRRRGRARPRASRRRLDARRRPTSCAPRSDAVLRRGARAGSVAAASAARRSRCRRSGAAGTCAA